MSEKRFELFQKSIDDDLLEEAGAYREKRVNVFMIASMAACFCAVLAGLLAWHPWNSKAVNMTSQAVYSAETAAAPAEVPAPEAKAAAKTAGGELRTEGMEDAMMEEAEEESAEMDVLMDAATFSASAPASAGTEENGSSFVGLVNPMHEASLKELEKLGYSIPIPSDAEVTWSGTIAAADTELAQVDFLLAGEEYTWRAQRTKEQTDISGVYDSAAAESCWEADGLSVILRKGSEGTLLLWYAEERSMQWCLWGRNAEPDDILAMADEMAQEGGFSVFAPIG